MKKTDPSKTSVPFDSLVAGMETGDLMLFNGKYSGSKLIELMEFSPWSHCGVIVRMPGIDEPLIFEATSLANIPDVMFHDQKPGIKTVSLRERMQHYGDDLKEYEPARFAYRKLSVERTPAMQQALEGLMNQLHGIPDPGFGEMVWNVVKGRVFGIPVDLSHYFCSELVAKAYMTMGLLSDKRPVNAFIPSDFSDRGRLDMLQGHLEQEIYVTIPHI